MSEEIERTEREDLFSKAVKAGKRTYFFDVKSTRGNDYYLTITESKKFTHDDGSFHYKKHKIYLYKEDFEEFNEMLKAATDYILNEKGEEVISERHQKDFKKPSELNDDETSGTESFTDLNFEDI